ncbi:DUF6124 family protein [Pseudomonas sp. NMI1173_11]|uniref:DUF6124 family protein n=1 Tax=Pseudomonas sp. NMI1173_11 TaxID=2903145 RepID=UPI001E613C0C|nr:hypothetical protein [Pseudomonas sp. NMI1173_11]MCE0999422.1 hypothetical protein [Pseudomonas sp. NMI1173_11]
MKPPKNDETDLDSEAARRALDYYLNPNPPRPSLDNKIWTLHEGVTNDQAQQHAIALLRCAAATAQETASHQHGSQRELTFALMHMMDMARALCEEVFCLALRENKREEAGRKWKSPDSLG